MSARCSPHQARALALGSAARAALADGALLLQGGSSGRGFHYRARYEGRLGADGVARFTGTQDWMLDDRDFTRVCAAEVRR